MYPAFGAGFPLLRNKTGASRRLPVKENDRLLRATEVCQMIGVSRTTLHRIVKTGEFPPAIRIGKRGSRWHLSEVVEWMDSRPVATAENWT